MVAFSFTAALKTFFRSVSFILLTKDLEEPVQNPRFIFLFYCLTLWPCPGACVKLSLKLDRAIQSPPLTHQLEKRDANFFRYGFAVCELPFYEICSLNVSRIQCSELGCCFHKETCYKKAVPQYMKTFVAFILIIMVIFVLFLVISCCGRRKKRGPSIEEDKQAIVEDKSDTSSSSSDSQEQDDED
ncbi:testis-expressed protein 29 [Hemicordylus capensis]|uniref:testis-expressed protein 29 n=1 Tax=Hemicordylus capensis TaxID=884348 RepID=UPI002303E163|nr:testis-expressed protein 29 [Hemicordylus capensis]XP_053168942.1 testis-expressed protein 29 [Hemicordylus capensis]